MIMNIENQEFPLPTPTVPTVPEKTWAPDYVPPEPKKKK